jgi:hypothetical protein
MCWLRLSFVFWFRKRCVTRNLRNLKVANISVFAIKILSTPFVAARIVTFAASSTNSIASNRRACHLYIWNAPSALLSRWCNHLQKDNIYEGRGGKKVGVSIFASHGSALTVVLNTTHSD